MRQRVGARVQEKAGGVFGKSRKAAAVVPASLEDAFDWLRDVKPARPHLRRD